MIGADGIRSSVAELVGAPFERRGTGASAVTYGYWRGLEADGYEWDFRPRAASGLIPTNDGAANVFVVGTAGARSGGAIRRRYRALLAESSPDLAARVAGPVPPRRCGRSPDGRATSAGRTVRVGPSSATPATSRIRSARTGSPMRCATPSCSPGPSSP